MTGQDEPGFADNLKQALLARGMTASDLARRIWGDEPDRLKGNWQRARSRQRIAKYLNGQVKPKKSTVALIAETLELPVEQLTGAAPGLWSRDGNLTLIAVAEPGKVRLRVNQIVDQHTALTIFEILSA